MDVVKRSKNGGVMRPIDADLAVAKCNEDIEAVKDISQRVDGILDAIMNIHECPTVDAVEVVRCENCKYYKKSEVSDRMMCWRKDVDGQLVCYDFNPNDFCSYGKRRTDEEIIHQYHERHKEVLKEVSTPVGRNVMDALGERRTDDLERISR